MKNKKFLLQITFGILVSLLIIYWLYKSIEWNIVIDELKHVRYMAILYGLPIIFMHFMLRSYRWKILVKKDVPTKIAFDGIQLGNFINYILPLRAGEFARPYFVAKNSEVSFSRGMASVVVERFFDLAIVLIFFPIIASLLPDTPAWALQGAYALGGIAIPIFLGMLAASFIPAKLQQLVKLCISPLPEAISGKLLELSEQCIDGAAILHDLKKLFLVVTYSVVIWLSNFLLFYVWLLLLPSVDPTFLLASSLGVLVALAVAAPSAPGFIGVYQVGCIAGFLLFGYSKELAITYSLLTHVGQYCMYITYGIYLIFAYGLRIKEYAGQD